MKLGILSSKFGFLHPGARVLPSLVFLTLNVFVFLHTYCPSPLSKCLTFVWWIFSCCFYVSSLCTRGCSWIPCQFSRFYMLLLIGCIVFTINLIWAQSLFVLCDISGYLLYESFNYKNTSFIYATCGLPSNSKWVVLMSYLSFYPRPQIFLIPHLVDSKETVSN